MVSGLQALDATFIVSETWIPVSNGDSILQTKISRIAETGVPYMEQYLVEANVTIETL